MTKKTYIYNEINCPSSCDSEPIIIKANSYSEVIKTIFNRYMKTCVEFQNFKDKPWGISYSCGDIVDFMDFESEYFDKFNVEFEKDNVRIMIDDKNIKKIFTKFCKKNNLHTKIWTYDNIMDNFHSLRDKFVEEGVTDDPHPFYNIFIEEIQDNGEKYLNHYYVEHDNYYEQKFKFTNNSCSDYDSNSYIVGNKTYLVNNLITFDINDTDFSVKVRSNDIVHYNKDD